MLVVFVDTIRTLIDLVQVHIVVPPGNGLGPNLPARATKQCQIGCPSSVGALHSICGFCILACAMLCLAVMLLILAGDDVL